MNCVDISEQAPLYLAHELSGPDLRAFETHLDRCRSCAEEIELQVSIDARLRASIGSEIPETADLETVVRRQIRMVSRARRRRFLAAAAAVVFSVAGSAWWFTRTPRIYADAARDHQAEVVEHQPRRWRSELADVNALASRFGLPASAVAALGPAGSTLVHAKICRLDGLQVLHLVYKSGTREISLFVRRNDAGAATNAPVLVGHDYVDAFRTPRFSAIVVAAASRTDCLSFAQAAAAVL
jgi:anti-sigma factor RsiW